MLEADNDEARVTSARVFLVDHAHVARYEVALINELLYPHAEHLAATARWRVRKGIVGHEGKPSS
ncbi:hypothetical protein CHE218_32420 [Microbacterium sp. che218]